MYKFAVANPLLWAFLREYFEKDAVSVANLHHWLVIERYVEGTYFCSTFTLEYDRRYG